MLFGNNLRGKDYHITMPSNRPLHKVKSAGAFGGKAFIENVAFKKFNTKGKTKCQNTQTIFARNHYASDKIPPHYFKNCKFEDVDDASMAYFENPDPTWADIVDCGQFPCTAPNNILMSFTGTKYAGQTPARVDAAFQIIPDDPDIGGLVGGALPKCLKRLPWEGYFCTDRSLAYLVMESNDPDQLDRTISPINFLNETVGFNNTLNSNVNC